MNKYTTKKLYNKFKITIFKNELKGNYQLLFNNQITLVQSLHT